WEGSELALAHQWIAQVPCVDDVIGADELAPTPRKTLLSDANGERAREEPDVELVQPRLEHAPGALSVETGERRVLLGGPLLEDGVGEGAGHARLEPTPTRVACSGEQLRARDQAIVR